MCLTVAECQTSVTGSTEVTETTAYQKAKPTASQSNFEIQFAYRILITQGPPIITYHNGEK